MTETASLTERLTERLAQTLLDPVSLVAVALSAMALAVIWALRRRAGPRRAGGDLDAFAPSQPVPLLETPMEPVLAAPRRAAPQTGGPGVVSGLAFAAIGLVAFCGLVAAGLKIVGEVPSPVTAPLAEASGWQDDVMVVATGPTGCDPGLDGHAASYTHCGASVPVRFEVLGLAVDGERLTDAAWATEGRPFVLTAPSRPAPFTLAASADVLAAPGSEIGDYDAYVAVGYADAGDGADASARAEARSLALAGVALRAAQGGNPRDCRSDVMVHAVSLGASRDGPVPAPLLIGVHVEDRVNRPEGDAGDLNAMLDGLFASQGAVITGLRPEAYGPWKVVGSQRACRRSPV